MTDERPRIFPTFRCKNAAAVIDWLTGTIGFTEHAKWMNGDKVVHAELAYGSSMIMLGDAPAALDDYGRIVGHPGAPGGKSLFVSVEDPDALFARVKAAGTPIDQPPTDRDYGSREFVCRDPDGNVWCFGTYWPNAAG
jgi:uncharacterized glyoxalase superfamily protein PhnB